MKQLIIISLLLFSYNVSAQGINPDSAFVDTVKEWHVTGMDWYEERMKIASVKAIKDVCNDYAQNAYNAMKQIVKNMDECIRLGKKAPDIFNYNEEIANQLEEYKKADKELKADIKAYNTELKRNLTFVRNYKGKVKTKRLVDAALTVILDADLIGLDANACNSPLVMVINEMNLNDIY